MDVSELKSTRFELREELGKGGMGVVYEAYDHETDSLIALKTLRQFDADALYRFKNEFRALADVHHPNLVRFGELYCERGQWFFTMELVRGIDFQSYVRLAGFGGEASDQLETQQISGRSSAEQNGSANGEAHAAAPLPVARGFDEAKLRSAARQLALAIDALHRAGRIHRDLKPSNVLVRDDGHLLLLDFGLVQDVRRKSSSSGLMHYALTGTPAFIAPEQITRQHVGPPADWYSFGTMLFLALTGRLPFVGSADQIIAGKQSFDAPEAQRLCVEVPADLNALCRGLLARDPDARPAAHEILERLGAAGEVVPSPLEGARWSSDGAPLFVGRDAELGALVDSLASCRQGRCASVVVEGEPGVGKSALVRQFLEHHVALDPNAVVLAGRCYEQEAVPFKAFDTVVDSLTLYLAELDEGRVAPLLRAGTRYLASVFPVLRRVSQVASQAPVREVDNPLALRAQAFQELKRLLAAMAERVRLVLFIDDLQWADKDSLALLEHLIDPLDAPSCLLVATRRSTSDGEAARSGPTELLGRFRRLRLSGLSRVESESLWARLWGNAARDAVGAPQLETLLAEAAGHPFFLSELVRYTKTLERQLPANTSLRDVLWERVCRLEAPARRFMECVALAGAPIKLQVVARAAGLEVNDSLQILSGLRVGQMIRVSRRGEARLVETYHDRVREALVEHLHRDESARVRAQEMNLRLGRQLLDGTSEAELETEVFAIVRHLNLAAAMLVDDAERRRVAELNLLAARQAKLATAYEVAVEHLNCAIALLSQAGDAWQSSYDLCSTLHVLRMECEYLAGHRPEALAHFDELLPRLTQPQQLAELYVTKIGLDTGHGLFLEAIATGRAALPRFGVKLPGKATVASVLREYAATRLAQGRRPVAELANLPALDDVNKQCAMKILIALAPPAIFADNNLLTVCLMRIARLSMKHGLTDVSSYGFAGYGLVLCGAFLKMDEACAFGQLSLQLNERFQNHRLVSKLHCLNGTFLTPWVRPFADGEAQLRLSSEAGLKYGDTAYEAYSAATLAVITFCESADLAGVQACAERSRVITSRRRDADMTVMMSVFERYAAALRGLTHSPTDLTNAESSDAEFLASSLSETKTPTAMLYYYFCNGLLAYLFGERDRAATLIGEAGRRIERIFSIPSTVEVCLMEVLVAADRHAGASFAERLRLDWAMRQRLSKLRRWASACPQNFEAQYLLALAERARVHRDRDAGAHYARAVAQARKQGTAMREAMALELQGRFFREQDHHAEAGEIEREAATAYARWGAQAKADRLRSPLTRR